MYSWCSAIVAIASSTKISRLTTTKISDLATPHFNNKLYRVVWLGVTGPPQCLTWQGLAAYQYLADLAATWKSWREQKNVSVALAVVE